MMSSFTPLYTWSITNTGRQNYLLPFLWVGFCSYKEIAFCNVLKIVNYVFWSSNFLKSPDFWNKNNTFFKFTMKSSTFKKVAWHFANEFLEECEV